jgi:hypothetical protein
MLQLYRKNNDCVDRCLYSASVYPPTQVPCEKMADFSENISTYPNMDDQDLTIDPQSSSNKVWAG